MSIIAAPSDAVEEGEISDGQLEIDTGDSSAHPTARKIVEDDYGSDEKVGGSDDEAPEEILNMKPEPIEEIDPKLCRVCKKEPHKYKCPKCSVRTCSLACSKSHKENNSCDGVQGAFPVVEKLSQYSAGCSIADQAYLKKVEEKIISSPVVPTPNVPSSNVRSEDTWKSPKREQLMSEEGPSSDGKPTYPVIINEDGTRSSCNSAQERFLMPNAIRRGIHFCFSSEKEGEDGSRHEQFSDSIFWCIDFIFRKELGSGEVVDYPYRVQGIPETIRVCTLLKQFFRPRKYGCVVSESDLDLNLLKPFHEAGAENVNLFMRVPRFEKERYYVVSAEKNILENLRSRVVVDHPKIIVVLNNEFMSYQTLSEDESICLKDKIQAERRNNNKQMNRLGSRGGHANGGYRGNRGGFERGGRGGFGRGGGRGRGRGGFSHGDGESGEFSNSPHTFPQKRRFEDHDRHNNNNFKRGRGGFRGRYQHQQRMESFDPFEPFNGPVSLPLDSYKTSSYRKEPTEDSH